MYTLKNSIPILPSIVRDYTNDEVDMEEKVNQTIVRNTFNFLFNTKMKDDYWNILWNMIKTPTKTLGLVGIDEPRIKSKKDSASYGLAFNLGRPKLRSRKIHYMPRIYAMMCLDSDNFCTFYNSPYDIKDEDSIWLWRDMTNAYHPHISHGNPCLGNFMNDLERSRRDGNPILYLNVLNNFVNTWNTRSAFFNIHHDKQDFVYKEKGKLDKKYKKHQITEIFNKYKGNDQGYNYSNFTKFVHDYIGKVDSGNIKSDIDYIFNLWTLHQHNKTILINHIKTKINEDVESYLANIDYELNHRREDNPRLFSSNHSPIPVITNLLVPVRQKVGNLNTTRLKIVKIRSGHDYQHTKMLPLYRHKNELLRNMCYFISNLRNQYKNKELMPNEMLKRDDIGINMDYLYFNYIAKSNFKNLSLAKRKNRINRIMSKMIEQKVTKEMIMNNLDKYIKDAFVFFIEDYKHWDGTDTQIITSDSGAFWKSTSYRYYDDEVIEVMKLLHPLPDSFESLVMTYERIKESLIQEDIKHVINKHKKHIGELESYGYQTNNTSKDTQQVHLSFEEV